MAHAPVNARLTPDKWIALATASATDNKELWQAPFACDGIVYGGNGYRVHIAPRDVANVDAPNAESDSALVKVVSQSLLTARKGVMVTFPAQLLREVSAVMGKESKARCNILHVTLYPDRAEFYRPGQDIEVRASVSRADGYTVTGALPEDGLTIAVNPGYLLDSLAALPAAHAKSKRKGENVDTVRISVAGQLKPIAVDYGKLSAVIMPMTIN